jgi:mediator of RNA polymerase II transcription subunit 18, fungi type
MQEILLFGQIPADSHRTLRQQLAGITRMQPQPVLERHVIFKPVPPAGLKNLPSGSGAPGAQQQELQKTRQLLNAPLNYVQLVGILENKDVAPPGERQGDQQIGTMDQDAIMTDGKSGSDESSKELRWYLEFRDIPEPGKVTTTSRAMSKTRILDGDPIHFMTDLGYE